MVGREADSGGVAVRMVRNESTGREAGVTLPITLTKVL